MSGIDLLQVYIRLRAKGSRVSAMVTELSAHQVSEVFDGPLTDANHAQQRAHDGGSNGVDGSQVSAAKQDLSFKSSFCMQIELELRMKTTRCGALLLKSFKLFLPSAVLLVGALSPFVAGANDIASDLAAGKPLKDIVADAHSDGLPPSQVVSELLAGDIGAARAVQVTVREYGDCAATAEAVGAAVTVNGDHAEPAVRSVAVLKDCGCSGETHWQRTRVRDRLVYTPDHLIITMPQLCSCVSMAVEAAASVAPERIADLVEAAVTSTPQQGNLVSDDPELVVGQSPSGDVLLPSGRNDECEDGDDCDLSGDLVLNEILVGAEGRPVAARLRNISASDLDLGLGGYRMELFFEGGDVPGQVVQLEGGVASGEDYWLVTHNAPADIIALADQYVDYIDARAKDSVAIKNETFPDLCGCAEASVAAAVRGSKGSQEQGGEEGDTLAIADSFGGKVVDVFGRVGEDPEQPWGSDSLVARNNALQRQAVVCKGDADYQDPFNPQEQWQARGGVHDIGNHDALCTNDQDDLVISEYVESEEEGDVVELFNGTNRPVDLSEGRYVLHVFRPGSKSPDETIELKGTIEQGTTWILAHPDAEDEIVDKAHLTDRALAYDGRDTLVLRRVQYDDNRVCRADILALIDRPYGVIELLPEIYGDPPDGPNPITPAPPAPPGGQPASPN